MNTRIFVEKKNEFRTESKALKNDLNEVLQENINDLRIINVYDLFDIEINLLEKAKYTIFADSVTDKVTDSIDLINKTYIAYEYLPGQYDLRADSVVQCLQLLDEETNVKVKSSKIIILEGFNDFEKIKNYLINPIESCLKDLSVLQLAENQIQPETKVIDNFFECDLNLFLQENNLAMNILDLMEIKKYFEKENRCPTEVEIKMLDAYWSDHCRHSTFETDLTIEISDPQIKKSYDKYLKLREELKRSNKPNTLMDMARINALYEYKNGNLNDLEISEENNACSIFIDVMIDNEKHKYILMFKNETHNHPTEVEPFGGASTCIGGAIRDPLSGRSYVYQAARITGASNILEPVDKTIEGKLPQRFISKTAALGNSSYGNQIGLCNGLTKELFHPGYKAKRMELGAVVGCAPVENIVRKTPVCGDLILLLGGLTGRDGIGGASGSSREHTASSLKLSAAEVQKGNAPEERKLVRLYRNPKASRLIKKSNDFGAGGVSVCIGELASGIEIYLDRVPLKYNGLNALEIALSESQERMAVVIDPKDFDEFNNYCHLDNLSATVVGVVTDTNRLVMKYKEKTIVDLKRSFLDTNGVRGKAQAIIEKAVFTNNYQDVTLSKENILNLLSSLNVTSQKGLQEMFDSTIGANTVLLPLGGKYQLTENQVSVSLIPVTEGNCTTCSLLTYGFDPYLMEESPYYGAMYSVVESLSKITSVGADFTKVRFSFQEFFEKLGNDPHKWGKPVQSLLGTVDILEQFQLASIGGKDSMSGTFKDINVPPTLVSFAVCVEEVKNIISPEFKNLGSFLYLIKHNPKTNYYPNVSELKSNFKFIRENILNKNIISAYSVSNGGLVEALFKCSFGNKLGFTVNTNHDLFNKCYGCILVESKNKLNHENAVLLGSVTENIIINNIEIDKEEALFNYTKTLESIYPTKAKTFTDCDFSIIKTNSNKVKPLFNKKTVKILIPVFPGTNCDLDIYKAFKDAGGDPEVFIFRNNVKGDVTKSIKELKQRIKEADILTLAGGFSAGDEPDGSGKYIACILNNSLIKEEINNLIKRKGLILGICNGFQALVKAGFLPFYQEKKNVTLFKNDINRHVATLVRTKVISTSSPWFTSFNVGDIHTIPVSHGEGKFIISYEDAQKAFENGQINCVYCDFEGNPTMDPSFNVNGSLYAIESVTSSDGLILGKMAHSERYNPNTLKNIDHNIYQDIFKNAINYFKGKV